MEEETPTGAVPLEQSFELPALSADQQRALRDSIASEGLLTPVVVSAGPANRGEVADGRARVAICTELGVECPRTTRSFTSEAGFGYFRLTTNLVRRELTVAQRVRYALLLEPLAREQAAQRRAQARGKPRGTKALPVALPEQHEETREHLARAVCLKPSTYERGAKVIREGSPELVARFDAGQETVNSAYRKLRSETQRATKLALAEEIARNPPPLPIRRFPVGVIDPPWPYDGLPYPVMSIEEIAALPVPELLTADAIVWLWTTNRFLGDAITIATERWGLELRNIVTWDKERVGTGQWLLGQTEHCLLLTQGSPLFIQGNATTLIREPAREHSRKPEAFYALVEQTCHGAKLELFARQRRPNWHAWGAETDHFAPAEPAE